jgi:hypothetical protein
MLDGLEAGGGRTTRSGARCRVLWNRRLDTLHGQPVRFPLHPGGTGDTRRERLFEVRRKVNLVVWDVVQMLRRTGGCGDGDLREGGLRQWSWRDQNGLGRISEVLSLSYHIDANSIQTPRENRLALTSPKGRVAHLHIQRLHRMFDILR